MNRADETAAKIETAERQSVGAAAGSDDKLAKQLEDFPGASPQSRPALHILFFADHSSPRLRAFGAKRV
jgi:hypothetical protein